LKKTLIAVKFEEAIRKKPWEELVQLSPINRINFDNQLFLQKFSRTHSGNVKLHQYKLSVVDEYGYFKEFVEQDRFDEIDFVKNIIRHKDLQDYRKDLEIEDELLYLQKPFPHWRYGYKFSHAARKTWHRLLNGGDSSFVILGSDGSLTDIENSVKDNYGKSIISLSERLANILIIGGAYYDTEPIIIEGAYYDTEPILAKTLASDFIKELFQNRYDEVFYWFNTGVRSASNWFYDLGWDYSILLFDKRNYEVIIIDATDTD
jgi:hypothetical protein